MKTLITLWVVILALTGQAVAQFTVVPVKLAISTTPVTSVAEAFKGQTGNGYLPAGFSTSTDIYVSCVLQAFDDAGNRVAIKRPNFPSAKIRFETLYENQGVVRNTGLGGNQYIDLAGAVFTDPADTNPNPSLGKVWFYGADLYGNVSTPTGEPIADPNFTLMNGTYKVRSTDYEVWEIVIINANRKVWPQLVTGYNNLRAGGSQFNAFGRVWLSDIRVDSWLNVSNGCTKFPSYPGDALKHPTLYVGNQAGPVRPSLQVVNYETGQFLLKNARVLTGEVCRSPDLQTWFTIPASQMQIVNRPNGDTLITLLQNGGGGTTTTHRLTDDGSKCFYSLYSKE